MGVRWGWGVGGGEIERERERERGGGGKEGASKIDSTLFQIHIHLRNNLKKNLPFNNTGL